MGGGVVEVSFRTSPRIHLAFTPPQSVKRNGLTQNGTEPHETEPKRTKRKRPPFSGGRFKSYKLNYAATATNGNSKLSCVVEREQLGAAAFTMRLKNLLITHRQFYSSMT